MTTSEAIKILKDYIEIDRCTRNDLNKSDYDNFCEEKCVAIETLIKAYKESVVNVLIKAYQESEGKK